MVKPVLQDCRGSNSVNLPALTNAAEIAALGTQDVLGCAC
jgi:hypothetical protein